VVPVINGKLVPVQERVQEFVWREVHSRAGHAGDEVRAIANVRAQWRSLNRMYLYCVPISGAGI
jgi:hypothetical protein